MEESGKKFRPEPVTIDDQAVTHLLQFCREQQRQRLFLVADRNTYAALGEAVESALRAQGFDLKVVVLRGAEVAADAHYIL